jgi:hypothetical protein
MEATLVERTQELARTITSKREQGYTVESQTDTEAILVIKGRKRMFGGATDSRQSVKIDESGAVKFTKIDAAAA